MIIVGYSTKSNIIGREYQVLESTGSEPVRDHQTVQDNGGRAYDRHCTSPHTTWSCELNRHSHQLVDGRQCPFCSTRISQSAPSYLLIMPASKFLCRRRSTRRRSVVLHVVKPKLRQELRCPSRVWYSNPPDANNVSKGHRSSMTPARELIFSRCFTATLR